MNDVLGTSFVTDTERIHCKYTARCLKDTHCIIIKRKDLRRIMERIYKKNVTSDLNFMKEVPQFRKLSKKQVLRFVTGYKAIKLKRNQVLMQEGDPAKYFYMVKQGCFQVRKFMYRNLKETDKFEHKLLYHDPSKMLRYKSNFGNNLPFKK